MNRVPIGHPAVVAMCGAKGVHLWMIPLLLREVGGDYAICLQPDNGEGRVVRCAVPSARPTGDAA
jgi:hypothetical protein